MVVDHSKLDINKIFVTTDASDHCTGAILSFGPTWETARPVMFDSSSFKDAELNYPVHEKELLAVIRALKKWKYDLIGCPFYVYTDHKMLLNFATPKDLSHRQARWMETLSSTFHCPTDSCRNDRIPPESSGMGPESGGIHWNGTRIHRNGTGIYRTPTGIHRNGCIPTGMELFDWVSPICD